MSDAASKLEEVAANIEAIKEAGYDDDGPADAGDESGFVEYDLDGDDDASEERSEAQEAISGGEEEAQEHARTQMGHHQSHADARHERWHPGLEQRSVQVPCLRLTPGGCDAGGNRQSQRSPGGEGKDIFIDHRKRGKEVEKDRHAQQTATDPEEAAGKPRCDACQEQSGQVDDRV